MKKLLTAVLTVITIVALTACGARERRDIDIVIPDELPRDMAITLNLYTGFGEGPNAQAMQDIIDSFNDMYPMVTIILNNEGNYENLRTIVTNFIRRGTAPALIMGYPDNYAEYASADAIIPLDDFIAHPTHGIADELDDFIEQFLAENQQFEYTYSLPVMKSTQLVAYNKDIFAAHGITFEDNEIITWDRLHNEIAPIVVGNGPNQCENLLLVGSSGNAFINFMNQWGTGYTTQDGRRLFLENREETIATFADMVDMFQARTVVSTRAEWNDQYGSARFRRGESCMIDSSSAGVQYNIPSAGTFEIGFLPAIQKHATPEEGPMSVVQQGPNIAIGADTDDYERLAAWLFIRHATNAINSAHIAVTAQYMPVRHSSYETEAWLNFINSTDPDDAPYVAAAKVALAQQAWYNFDPAFIGQDGNPSSSRVRNIGGAAFEDLWITMDPEDTFEWLRSELE